MTGVSLEWDALCTLKLIPGLMFAIVILNCHLSTPLHVMQYVFQTECYILH